MRRSCGGCLTVLGAIVLCAIALGVGLAWYFGVENWAESLGGDRRESGSAARGTFWYEFSAEERAAHPVATWLLGPAQHYFKLWFPALVIGGGGVLSLVSWSRKRRRGSQPPLP